MVANFKIKIRKIENGGYFVIEIDREFENKYQAQNELTNMNKNGLIYVDPTSNLEIQKCYPPHRILEILFEIK